MTESTRTQRAPANSPSPLTEQKPTSVGTAGKSRRQGRPRDRCRCRLTGDDPLPATEAIHADLVDEFDDDALSDAAEALSRIVSQRERGSAAEATFLRALADEELRLIPGNTTDLARMAELVTTYADLPLGAVDASVLALAERLNDLNIVTLDRRHFTILRPSRGRSLHPAM